MRFSWLARLARSLTTMMAYSRVLVGIVDALFGA
jgi:hypothetical protein